MRTRLLTLLALTSTGCLDAKPEGARGTGALLSVDWLGGSDVVGFHFEIERVACDASDAFTPLSVVANVDLLDQAVPGQIEIVERTYDETSRHAAADLFATLPAGCYDVLAAPAAEIDGDDWVPSAECSVADAEGLSVVDGATTEVTLISQCVGDAVGALDTLVTLNHPPTVSVDFPTEDRDGDGIANGDDGKYAFECEPVEVCATITDPDDDPVEVVWASTGPAVFSFVEGDLQPIGFEDGHRVWEQCVTVVGAEAGSEDWTVSAWDLGYASGSLVRIESLVSPETSNDSLDFPVHVSVSEEPLCFDESGALVPVDGQDVSRVAGCDYTTVEELYCSGVWPTDPAVVDFVCDGTSLIEERLYPPCVVDPVATAGEGPPDLILAWSELFMDTVRSASTPPPRVSRMMAMVQGAMFDAVNGVNGRWHPWITTTAAPAGTDARAAAAAAAHGVLSGLYPTRTATFDALLAEQLAELPAGAALEQGRVYGASVAAAVLANRASDGAEDVEPFTVVDAVGLWRPTPPAYAAPLLPQWATVTPFVMSSPTWARPPAPPAVSSADFAATYEETRLYGDIDSTVRTDDQTHIALFWADGAGTCTPPGHWLIIGGEIARSEGMDLAETARMLALVGFATADAGIAAWDAKYAYNHVRPVTAITIDGDVDGNAATVADPTWAPLLTTPPFPEYVSGHSSFSGAGSQVIAGVLGRDEVSFTVMSDPASSVPGTARAYTSLSDAANEAGMSRIYGGIHWQHGNLEGLALGRDIGGLVVSTMLLPR
jgi:hypothetical protein